MQKLKGFFKGKPERLVVVIVLPIILAACLGLAHLISLDKASVLADSKNGSWDLSGYDFTSEGVQISGDVEYIPNALLNPVQYRARQTETKLSDEAFPEQYGTSRILLKMPDDGWYTLSRVSIDYSERVYVNGRLLTERGSPGDSKESTTPDIGRITFTVQAEGGVIEIIQQSANFVHRNGGYHGGWYVGKEWLQRNVQAADFGILMEMGAYLALFLFHTLLFLMLPAYRPNLFLGLFCLNWFFRMGTTGHSIFTMLLPGMNWETKFRIEYMNISIAIILMSLIQNTLFPDILPKWSRRISYGSQIFFIVLALTLDTVRMSWVAPFFLSWTLVIVSYTFIRFVRKIRRIRIDQGIFLAGLIVFVGVSVRDVLFYARRLADPSMLYTEMTQVGVLACALLADTAFFIATMREMAAAKEKEQRLAMENAALDQVSRLKSDLMVNLSHEIRTPLSVMSGYAQLSAQQVGEGSADQETRENLQVISREARRLAALAGGLLDTMSGDEAFKYRKIGVDTVIAHMEPVFKPLLNKNNNQLELKVQEQLPLVWIDGEKIQQLLLNLVTNANRHTKDGIVTIRAESGSGEESGCIAVTVADNGSGIDAELLPKVFERNISDGKGRGVGLAICRDIVRLHGGTIEIDSSPDRGTRVRFTIPIEKEGNKNADNSND